MKFYGVIGYSVPKETSPGVWTDDITEVQYRGDVLKFSGNWRNGDGLNDDMFINHRVSIVADAFAYNNYSSIKYVKWGGVRWKVTNIEVNRPRILLTLGGEYNGQQT